NIERLRNVTPLLISNTKNIIEIFDKELINFAFAGNANIDELQIIRQTFIEELLNPLQDLQRDLQGGGEREG
ncbi:MAG: hypothetical protein ACFBSE_05100, partial [Prochloraceae cyanobacterium]